MMKPSMSIILAGGGPKGKPQPREEDPKVLAMEDFISAVKAGDAEAAVVAYEDMCEAFDGHSDEAPVEDDEDDGGLEYK